MAAKSKKLPARRAKAKCRECEKLRERLRAQDRLMREGIDHRRSLVESVVSLTAGRDTVMAENTRIVAEAKQTYEWNSELVSEHYDLGRRIGQVQADLARERADIADLIRDLQLVTLAGTHMLCGSQWIRGEGVLEAIRRYTEKIEVYSLDESEPIR